MPEIPQMSEDVEFWRKSLKEGYGYREYNGELSVEMVENLVRHGHMVLAEFVHWEGTGSDGKSKERFVQDLHLHSQQWEKKGTRMETKESFESLLRDGGRLFSFDVKAGYRRFSLLEDMWNSFMF